MERAIKMAALRDGERLSFKSFVNRRRTEYSLRFPFLTERQIAAKLRRVWESQKGSTASKCRKREPAPAIQSPPVPQLLITPTNAKGLLCSKGDLSAFDLESDSTHYHRPPTTKRYSKCCHSNSQSHKATKSPTSTDQLHINQRGHCEHQISDENDATANHQCVLFPSCLDGTYRQPLMTLENTHPTSVAEQPGINVHCVNQSTPQCSETSHRTCESLRKEVKCCVTNTLPFASGEAQRNQSVVSMGTGGSWSPIMASNTSEVYLKHTLRYGMSESLRCKQRYPAPHVVCDEQQAPPLHHAQRDTDVSGQSSTVSGDHRAVPLNTSPIIQSLPSPVSTTPSGSAFLQDGVRLMPRPVASSTDEISSCSVFDTGSLGSIETQFPSSVSNTATHHSSHVALPPLTSYISSSNEANEVKTSSLSGAPVAPGNASGIGSLFQRRRRKARVRTFSHCKTTFYSPESLEREQRGGRMGGKTVTCGTSVLEVSVEETHSLENGRKNSNRICTESLTDSRENADVGVSSNSSCPSGREQRQTTEQLVPEPTPQNTPLNQSGEQDPTAVTSVKEDLMCDMFRCLTPDRPKSGLQDRHHSRGADACEYDTKRRVFRSACTGGDSNFYSMFVDESDIFM